MTTIRTTCPRCGEVDMGPESILLLVTRGGREGTYRFTCPTCMDDVEKRADRKIVALLVSAGVDVAGRGGGGTAELFEDPGDEVTDEDPRGPLPAGPPFSIDDLIDFHFRLMDDAYIQEFFARQ
ncbi:MAG TPA: hypothetical protein VE669_01950 [Actinomycetota bacterium]|jgi:predicted RNA-binding Zn-ribbon protein involved in translation (DUF1610 family)|nr:hypothetical protein [Actinomycetota bacterium]